MSPEGWLRQHRKVHRIEQRAGWYRLRAAGFRRGMRTWFSRIGNPEIMAWSFAAGLVWASGRGRTPRRVKRGRAVMRFANSVLLAWQFVHRVRATGAALGLGSPRRQSAPPGPAAAESQRRVG
jgi:hypothetical protein